MTSEEFEISYCKGKREAMTCFADWLRDHITDRTLEFMAEVADRMDGKLSKEPMLISKEINEKQD